MKYFNVRFYSQHDRLSNRYATMKMQGKNLESILPRVKKVEKLLNKLPNPYDHKKWIMTEISEIEKPREVK